jgi:hypothetical protein
MRGRWKAERLEFGREYWQALIAECEANVTAMGRIAGIRRNEVYKVLKRYGVLLPPRPPSHPGRRGSWGQLVQ